LCSVPSSLSGRALASSLSGRALARSLASHVMLACLNSLTAARKLVLLKLFSLFAGAFLVVSGVIGTSSIFVGGGFVYFIGSLYTIVFGLLVLVVEIKDKTPPISAAYELVQLYLKFLTLQRSKGVFYLGVGLLLFFIGPHCDQWVCFGVINWAAQCLIAAGLLHACAARESPRAIDSGAAPCAKGRCCGAGCGSGDGSRASPRCARKCSVPPAPACSRQCARAWAQVATRQGGAGQAGPGRRASRN